jgi:N4-(beta-N-acetylglucosaminyl)-L-asparaginase
VVIASHNGLAAVARAGELIGAGADTLDAVIAGVSIVEADPREFSVGFGGLPNAEGIVELDAAVMHGPSHGAGAVSALRNIKTPSAVAQRVMQATDHMMLVGEGALRFARAQGFLEENLLTEEARRLWHEWQRCRSEGPGGLLAVPAEVPDEEAGASGLNLGFTYGTIHCSGLDAQGNLSAVTSTSGLSFRLPGRTADSAIVGASIFVDNLVGAAGATGRGEAAIKVCGAHTVVEGLRRGLSPEEACLEALRRVVDHTVEPRLLRKDGRPNFNLTFYALAKNGRYGAATLWSGREFAVYVDGRSRLEECAFLFRRPGGGAG